MSLVMETLCMQSSQNGIRIRSNHPNRNTLTIRVLLHFPLICILLLLLQVMSKMLFITLTQSVHPHIDNKHPVQPNVTCHIFTSNGSIFRFLWPHCIASYRHSKGMQLLFSAAHILPVRKNPVSCSHSEYIKDLQQELCFQLSFSDPLTQCNTKFNI